VRDGLIQIDTPVQQLRVAKKQVAS